MFCLEFGELLCADIFIGGNSGTPVDDSSLVKGIKNYLPEVDELVFALKSSSWLIYHSVTVVMQKIW